MTRVAATLRGYASVARASEVLHLAPRSVRDLIYAGRLPSLRVGRLHYIKASDLELERRRRLGLPPPEQVLRHAPVPRPRRVAAAVDPGIQAKLPHTDPTLRRQQAAERAAARAALVHAWAQRHGLASAPRLPFRVLMVVDPFACVVCRRELHRGRFVELSPEDGHAAARLCSSCGRRALLEWADRRRAEASAARQLAQALRESPPEAADQPRLLVA